MAMIVLEETLHCRTYIYFAEMTEEHTTYLLIGDTK